MAAGTETARIVAGGKSRIDWTPYVTGAGIGVLSWIVFVVANDPLGITTSLSAVAGFAVMPFAGAAAVRHNTYWMADAPSLSYGSLFLVGVVLGGLAASLWAGQFRMETVPATWRRRFGASAIRRLTAAFFGGAVMMYGARLADGCASGHGISGTLQLALSSWVFTILTFVTAVLAGSSLFRDAEARR